MNPQSPAPPRKLLALDPVVVGTAYCIASALCYTGANICLRKLAVEADKTWTICIKELVTVAVIGPWLVFQAGCGGRVLPGPRTLLALALTGLAVQLGGNLPMQWAFGTVGIAITIPAVFGVMLGACALFGLVFLGERVPPRSLAAIGLLIGSIVLLSAGKIASYAPQGREAAGGRLETGDWMSASLASRLQPSASSLRSPASGLQPSALLVGLLGVGACCLAGVMFAVLSTVIRHSATAQVPVATIVFIVTGMGVLSLGSLSVGRLGVAGLLETDPRSLAWMLAAGAFNLLGFLAISKGLQRTTVVEANVLNASQVAMGALAGVVLFGEALNPWLAAGIALTLVGILLIGRPQAESSPAERAWRWRGAGSGSLSDANPLTPDPSPASGRGKPRYDA